MGGVVVDVQVVAGASLGTLAGGSSRGSRNELKGYRVLEQLQTRMSGFSRCTEDFIWVSLCFILLIVL
jgi:hypothetical protein